MSISQRVENILNGVSQQPPALRHPSQATEQINALALPSRGVSIRPNTKHISQINATYGASSYFIHRFRVSETERYKVIIAGGTLQVFDDLTGAELTVTISDAGYLTGSDFRAATVDGTTYIINRDKVIALGTKRAPASLNDAIIYVRQVDYSTTYNVTITENVDGLPSRISGKKTGTGGTTVKYVTPDGTDPKARQGITTDTIAAQLFGQLASDAYVTAYYTVELIGSTIYLKRNDDTPYAVKADDGLADKGLNAIKGSVQSFDELPARAKNGFVVEIIGDDASAFDRYYVTYDDTDGSIGHGVWKECAQPDSIIEIDATTLPHKLVLGGEFLTATVGQLPAPPSITDDAGTLVTVGPTQTGTIPNPTDTNPWTGTTAPTIPNADPQTPSHGGFFQWTPTDLGGSYPTDPNGQDLSMTYHADTSVMDPGTTLKIQMLQLDPTHTNPPTVLAENTHESGQTLINQEIKATGVNLNGQPIVLQATYNTGNTPGLVGRQALITVPME